jgi:hypothetical protein
MREDDCVKMEAEIRVTQSCTSNCLGPARARKDPPLSL